MCGCVCEMRGRKGRIALLLGMKNIKKNEMKRKDSKFAARINNTKRGSYEVSGNVIRSC